MKRAVSLAANDPLAKICTRAIHVTAQSHASAILLPGRKFPPYRAAINAVRPEHSGPPGAVSSRRDANAAYSEQGGS